MPLRRLLVLQGTPEQRKMVADILKAKDFYEILSLQRNCTDDDIKKAYRRVGVVFCMQKSGVGWGKVVV